MTEPATASPTIEIEVAYARADAQALVPVKGAAGMTIDEAITRSGVLLMFPEIDLARYKVGIFGKAAKRETALQSGDRVEIYPPLIADPKQARKDRAAGAQKGAQQGAQKGGQKDKT